MFLESEYFTAWNAILNSKSFEKMVNEFSLTVQFYSHPRFERYRHHLTSEFIEILTEDKVNIQDLLKENDLLITDYSSVGLDFAIMKKRVIYYQFDSLEKMRDSDLEKFLPGDILHTQEELLEQIEKCVRKRSCLIKWKYRRRLKDLFLFNDARSCERIYNEIMKKLEN